MECLKWPLCRSKPAGLQAGHFSPVLWARLALTESPGSSTAVSRPDQSHRLPVREIESLQKSVLCALDLWDHFLSEGTHYFDRWNVARDGMESCASAPGCGEMPPVLGSDAILRTGRTEPLPCTQAS